MATQFSHFPRSKHSDLFLNPFFSPYFPSNALTNPVVLPLKHIQILVFFYTFWSKIIITTDQDICNSHLFGLPSFSLPIFKNIVQTLLKLGSFSKGKLLALAKTKLELLRVRFGHFYFLTASSCYPNDFDAH